MGLLEVYFMPMGIFSFLKSSAYENEEDAISAIIDVACFGIGTSNNRDKSTMERVLNSIEKQVSPGTGARLLYWLAIGWRNYTAWHVKGDEKKLYLEKAVNRFKDAFEKSISELPVLLPQENKHNSAYLDQISIASDLAMLLMDYKVRDFEQAEKYLKFVYDNTDDYEPCFCAYLELFLDRDEAEAASKIAEDVLARTKRKTSEWKNVPPGFLGDARSAFQKMAEKEAANGNTTAVAKWEKKILDLNIKPYKKR